MKISYSRTISGIPPWRRMLGVGCVCLPLAFPCLPASAQDATGPDADHILKAMATHLGSLKAFSFNYETDTEIIDSAGQKLQFSASGTMALARQGKLKVTRKVPDSDAAIYFDGKMISLYGKTHNVYAQIASPGPTVDEAIGEFRMATGLDVPGADLMVADPYTALTEDTEEGAVIGTAYVDGVKCEHLAFRNHEVDWQIWISMGDQPLPMKYVITTKWLTGAPEYSLQMTNWAMDPSFNDSEFAFTPPADARKIEQISSNEIGEVTLEVNQ
jgi:hypothetical protein